jgi:hypothetical protein
VYFYFFKTVYSSISLVFKSIYLGCNIVRVRLVGPGPVWSLVQSGLIISETGPGARRVAKSLLRLKKPAKNLLSLSKIYYIYLY